MKIAIIGAGAAGYFAAIHAAKKGFDTWIFEKGNKTLSKVKVSGGGRCNVTNVISEPGLLVRNYPRGNKELRGPFTKFNSTDTVNWFQERGVVLKAEPDGRMFPVTDSSQTIIDCLTNETLKLGVKIKLNCSVMKIVKVDSLFELTFNNNETAQFNSVIVATGGNPSLNSYQWLQQLGHTIIPPVPSLFTFNIPDSPFKEIMGVSVQEVLVKIQGTKFEQEGPLLFTHWGLSGPAVLKLSAWGARWLNERKYDFNVSVNFIPSLSEAEVQNILSDISRAHPSKKIHNTPGFNLPSRLWLILCSNSEIDDERKWSEIGKAKFQKLIHSLMQFNVHVKGKTTFKEEFVTCGGVALNEVNMQTMESKIVKGLYFAGEILDIDGITGGFNFQAAWTTGFIAGNSPDA